MRLSAKAPIVIRGEEITHLDADGYKHLPRATSLPDGKVLATSGGKWMPGDLSGISVSSVFGRTGAVAAQAGDYTAAQVGAEPYAGVPAQTSFWRSTAAGVRAWVQLVAADITDLATTLALYLPKANPEFTGALKQAGVTRIASGGGAWFASMQSTNLVGAGDRPVAADLTGTLQPKAPDQFRNMIFALASPLKGAANGVAELGADGKVPVAQLPSAALLALGETPATAYRGDRGKTAYDHSQIATGNPHGTTAADVGAMATADPVFTGTLKQGAVTRLSSSGGADFSSLRVSNLSSAFNGVLVSDYVGIAGVRGATDFRDNYIQAAPAAHNHFSKLDVSASTTIGSIDATAIKVTATDVILTLSGGTDGTSWDIINPTTSTGIAIPSGATLWKTNGFDVGQTTIALGGGRPIRITRIDANTWTMLGSQ